MMARDRTRRRTKLRKRWCFELELLIDSRRKSMAPQSMVVDRRRVRRWMPRGIPAAKSAMRKGEAANIRLWGEIGV